MRILICLLLMVSLLMADQIDSTVNAIMKMKLYEPDQLKRQLEKIEKEFPGIAISTDTVLLREVYTLEGSRRHGTFVNGLGYVITDSKSFRNSYSGSTALSFGEELILNPDKSNIPNSYENFRKWGKVALIGGSAVGVGGILLVTAGGIALSAVGDGIDSGNNGNSDSLQSPSTSHSRLETASKMATVGGIITGVGTTALWVYLPTLIIKVNQNRHWQDDKIAYHNRRRISIAIKTQAQQ